MRSLVTGASGYLGRTLVPALLSRGHEVAVSFFRGEAASGAAASVRGDLRDPEIQTQLCERLAETDVVLHLAGIAHQRATGSDYQAINIDATLALGERAKAAGVRRFIFVSSIKAADAATASSTAPTEGVPLGELNYGSSKLQAEAGLRELCADSSMELCIVRPSLVYDGDSVGHLALLKRWVMWRLPPPPDVGSLAMIGRQDLVELLCVLTECAQEVPAMITATDGERYSTRRLYSALSQVLERRSYLPSPPLWLWRGATSIWDRARGERAGITWERLAGDSFAEAQGLESIPFKPRLTFESNLGLGG